MNQHQHSIETTAGTRRESIEQIAEQYGIQPHHLTPEVIFTMGQLQCAQMVAISEGCGSGELPDRLRARVEEREQELRRLLDEQDQQPAGQDDDNRDTSHGQDDPAVADILATVLLGENTDD